MLDIDRYKYSTSPGKGLDNSEALPMRSFSSWNALSHSAVHVRCRFPPFRALKNEAHQSIAFEINLVNGDTRPVRLLLFLCVLSRSTSMMVLIFSSWPQYHSG